MSLAQEVRAAIRKDHEMATVTSKRTIDCGGVCKGKTTVTTHSCGCVTVESTDHMLNPACVQPALLHSKYAEPCGKGGPPEDH